MEARMNPARNLVLHNIIVVDVLLWITVIAVPLPASADWTYYVKYIYEAGALFSIFNFRW